MFRNTLDKYKNDLGEIKHDEKALKEELSRVRFNYNFCNCFSSGVILTLFGGFLGSACNTRTFVGLSFSLIIFAIVVMVLGIVVYSECVCYEEMKFIEDELEKINNTVQPKPKKPSIRICNRNLVRRSVFGK